MNLKDEHQSVALTVQYLIKCQIYPQFPLLFMCMAKNIMAIQVLWEVTVTEAGKVHAKSCMVYVKHTY